MPTPIEWARSVLAVQQAAKTEALKQGNMLFGSLRREVEGSIPCRCTLVDNQMTEEHRIELTVDFVFDKYSDFYEHEDKLGDHVDECCDVITGWSRSGGEGYAYRAKIRF